ncbi:cysteine hydrolase family protein [Steroidobacter sp.]|uniref:cysteine hydrolase family protein n=1 Tax=Steroidobacter sp. TaxID=1978227 RepID=UPI001A51DDDE|nr:isochorismatase family cysteine hydrolase [Steroidobacter sp.]MBL8269275.1 cysteine hydrolase [Steroidobacter sp.]
MTSLILNCERGRSITLEPRKTALACIDFQKDFVAADGMAASRGASMESVNEAIPAAQRVLMTARNAGIFVFHTREVYAPDLSDLNAYRKRNDSAVGAAGPLGRFMIQGERGSDIVASMQPAPGEPVIDKAGFSAFHQTSLDTILRTRGIEVLLLTGVTTQCCVASTLRAAVDIGYSCVLLKDACAAYDPADHEATVRVIYSENDTFGWVSDSRRFMMSVADRH